MSNLDKKYDLIVLNYWNFNNFGGLLTCYALQEMLKDLNKNPAVGYINDIKTNEIFDFAIKYLNLTPKIIDRSTLNNLTDTFIVGSDCVWWPSLTVDYRFLLDFAYQDKKRIAYAPSFCQNFFDGSSEMREIYQYFLNKFDNISTREISGVDICKNEFGLDATQVMDPVFCIPKEKYYNLIQYNEEKSKNYFVHYIFVHDDAINNQIQYLKDKYKNYCNINMQKTKISVFEWLSSIKNADFVLTQSFHAACFAIIFNVPFVFTPHENIDNARIESILKIIGLENRIIYKDENFEDRTDLFEPIDWDRVNSIIEKEKERSLKWLKDALETPKDLSKIKPEDAIINHLYNKVLELQNTVNDLNKRVSVQNSRIDFNKILNSTKLILKIIMYKIKGL